MDIFSLVARLTLDKREYEEGINDARGSFAKLGEGLKSGLKTAAKVGTAAISAAATGVAALTKQSVEQYAEYEQLVGGVETLFGKSAKQVQAYAEQAYKTAGLSASEYMATVTSFSASLLQSLGGDTGRAAQMADMAITDMSDNANKMGTDMSAIQNAYNGFAKQNFTMLDNLKLGYGGTKQEMERLLADAERLSGQKFDVSSYADIVKAIHIVQTEMGITGTTAKEASGTISGSLGMLKSAWADLVTGLGNENAKFDVLIRHVMDSAVTAGNNLIPRIQQVLSGIAKLVENLAPVIAAKMPELVQQLLPPLLSAAQSLLESLVGALPDILKIVIDVLPGLIDMLIVTIADMSPELVELGVELLIALAEGLIVAIPKLVEKAPVIISRIVDTLVSHGPELLDAGIRLMAALGDGIIQSVGKIGEAISRIVTAIGDGIGDAVQAAWNWGADMIQNFTDGIKAFVSKPIDAVKGLAAKITSFLGFSEPDEGPLSNFHTFAPDMMALFAQGIEQNKGLITSAIGDAFNLAPKIAAAQTPAGGQEIVVPRGGAEAARDITIVVKLPDDTELGRAVYRMYNDESRRMGAALSVGGAY